jgi:glycogen debranching enzyme
VPWFVAVFGRDSLIASLQNIIVFPDFARGTLQRLAELQATDVDAYRDAEPGKIPHELRRGELAHFRRIPHTPYYGTADVGATLYCLLTGRPPIYDTSAGEVLRQVQQGVIPPVRQVKPDVPAALDAICRKALALRPEDRYPTPTALVRDLEHWLAEETLSHAVGRGYWGEKV